MFLFSSLSMGSMGASTRDASETPVFDPLPPATADNPKFAALRDIYASTPSLIDVSTTPTADASQTTPTTDAMPSLLEILTAPPTEELRLGETDC